MSFQILFRRKPNSFITTPYDDDDGDDQGSAEMQPVTSEMVEELIVKAKHLDAVVINTIYFLYIAFPILLIIYYSAGCVGPELSNLNSYHWVMGSNHRTTTCHQLFLSPFLCLVFSR
jgi:hypothetical protein